MKKTIYLARFGKVHGPFSEAELESFQASGKITEFSWIWNMSAHAWSPIDPPPPPLVEGAVSTVLTPPPGPMPARAGLSIVPSIQAAIPAAAGPSPMDLGFPSTRGHVPVICHNYRQVVSGTVHRMTATGCELLTEEQHFSPPFVTRSSVILNLLDADSGKLMNVSARVCGVARSPNGWTFQVRWEQRPAA